MTKVLYHKLAFLYCIIIFYCDFGRVDSIVKFIIRSDYQVVTRDVESNIFSKYYEATHFSGSLSATKASVHVEKQHLS